MRSDSITVVKVSEPEKLLLILNLFSYEKLKDSLKSALSKAPKVKYVVPFIFVVGLKDVGLISIFLFCITFFSARAIKLIGNSKNIKKMNFLNITDR